MPSALLSIVSSTPSAPSRANPKATKVRVDYVDALRGALILLVVAHHSVESYVASRPPEIVFADAPIPRLWAFLAVNAAFFMGLFFFLSGYYTPGAFDRRGAGRFLVDRFLRIGVPFLIGAVFIAPFATWLRYEFYPGAPPVGFWEFMTRDFLGVGGLDAKPADWPQGERWPQINFGPLWFLQHLLMYALVYAAWRLIAPARRTDRAPPTPPTSLQILAYAAALSVATYVIRIWYPQNMWVRFLGFIQMEPAHLPQYASLFFIGVLAGRGQWVETLPRRVGLAWLAVGVALAVFAYAMVGFGAIGSGTPPAGGGWPSWRTCIWESFTCTALCVGLPVVFRELRLGGTQTWRMLGRNVFAIYVFHYPIVLIVQAALMETGLPKWSRLLLTWPAAVAITIALTNEIVLRTPGLKRIF